MGQLSDTLFYSVPSILEALQEEGTPVPENLLYAVKQLKKRVQEILQGNEELFEENLETLFPEVWRLRLAALPFLAQLEMTEAIHKIELDLEAIAAHIPPLKVTAERLKFGLDLMTQFVNSLVAKEPDLLRKVADAEVTSALDYHEMMAQISAMENEQAIISFLNGSLMMELLLFALHQIAEGQAPETAKCHELQYLSAEAVEAYAARLGIHHTQLPWYQSPKSDFQEFLLAGPVANAEQLQFIKEKRAHFNTWM